MPLSPIHIAILDAVARDHRSARQISLDALENESAIRNIKRGSDATISTLDKLCRELGLEFYVGPPRHDGSVFHDGSFSHDGAPVATVSLPETAAFTLSGEDFAAIPLRETQASAGSGMSDQGMDVVGTLAFRRAWLQKLGIPATRASLIRVRGDSMAPQLLDGDVILIDQRKEPVRNGAIYVIRVGPDLFVKRLYRDGTRLVAASDNPDHAPMVIDGAQTDFGVEGRVCWTARELPLP